MKKLRIILAILISLTINHIAQAEDDYKKMETLSQTDNFVAGKLSEEGSLEFYISKAVATQDPKERELWCLKAIEDFPYRSVPAVALLHSEYVTQAVQLGNSGNVEAASELLNKTRKLQQESLMRIDETPASIWQEIMIDFPKGPITKEEFKANINSTLEGINQMEKEWMKKGE